MDVKIAHQMSYDILSCRNTVVVTSGGEIRGIASRLRGGSVRRPYQKKKIHSKTLRDCAKIEWGHVIMSDARARCLDVI